MLTSTVSFAVTAVERLNKYLFIMYSYLFDVFFVCDAIKCDMPDRDVKALAVGSTFSLVVDAQAQGPESDLRQRYDLHISCRE